jgi:hypothetical protein
VPPGGASRRHDMSVLTTALVRLYPRDWRVRYGAEMSEMLASERLTLRTATDLVAGAIDARLNPQVAPAGPVRGAKGCTMTARMFQCSPAGVTKADNVRSAGWMIGGSLAMVVVSVTLQATLGRNSFSEALLYGAFPAALMLSSECTYFKPYSRAARLTLSVGGASLILLMMWVSVLIGDRI